MTKTIYPIKINQTTVSGTWSFNTLPIQYGILRHILVVSASSTTTFDFKTIDDANNVIYDSVRKETTATGTLDDQVQIPINGICTLRVFNASSDEAFTGRLMVED